MNWVNTAEQLIKDVKESRFDVNRDEWLCRRIGWVAAHFPREAAIAVLEEICDMNYGDGWLRFFNTGRLFGGAMYFQHFFSLGEICLRGLRDGDETVIENYLTSKYSVARGQAIFYLSTRRNPDYRELFKDRLSVEKDEFLIVDNLLYALYVLDGSLTFPIAVRYLSWRPYYHAAWHIVHKTASTEQHLNLLEEAKRGAQPEVQPLIQAIEDNVKTGQRYFVRSEFDLEDFDEEIPLGLVLPHQWESSLLPVKLHKDAK